MAEPGGDGQALSAPGAPGHSASAASAPSCGAARPLGPSAAEGQSEAPQGPRGGGSPPLKNSAGRTSPSVDEGSAEDCGGRMSSPPIPTVHPRRGRPPLNKAAGRASPGGESSQAGAAGQAEMGAGAPATPRRRGRPPLNRAAGRSMTATSSVQTVEMELLAALPVPRRRGRPPLNKAPERASLVRAAPADEGAADRWVIAVASPPRRPLGRPPLNRAAGRGVESSGSERAENASALESPAPRGPGSAAGVSVGDTAQQMHAGEAAVLHDSPPKRRRGRPPLSRDASLSGGQAGNLTGADIPIKRKRGRPPLNRDCHIPATGWTKSESAEQSGRGRPLQTPSPEPRRRGRPPLNLALLPASLRKPARSRKTAKGSATESGETDQKMHQNVRRGRGRGRPPLSHSGAPAARQPGRPPKSNQGSVPPAPHQSTADRPGSDATPSHTSEESCKYDGEVATVRKLLLKVRREMVMLEAYEADGWQGASREKVKPVAELAKARKKVETHSEQIRSILKALDEPAGEQSIDASKYDSEGELDEKDIFCAVCGIYESTDNNDIILCDGSCSRAYHQRCVEPNINLDLLGDDDNWLCPACNAKEEIADMINEELGTQYDLATPWADFLPPSEGTVGSFAHCKPAETGNATADLLLGEDLPSDDEDDEDFSAIVDCGASMSSNSSSDNSEGQNEQNDEGEPFDVKEEIDELEKGLHEQPTDHLDTSPPQGGDAEASLVLTSKRRRTKVDYRALNQEMFGDTESDNGEGQDDGDYDPLASPHALAQGNR